jgi:hypothetical protein
LNKTYTATELSKISYSPIMVVGGQLPEGLKNTLYCLTLITLSWVFVGITNAIFSFTKHHSRTRIVTETILKATKYSLPNGILNLSIITLAFSSIVTFKHADLSSAVGIISLVTSASSIIYILAMATLYTKSLLTNSKTFEDLASEQPSEVSGAGRIYEVIVMIRKLIVAILVAALFESPTIQLGSVIGVNVLFSAYAAVFNPYGILYRVFDVVS